MFVDGVVVVDDNDLDDDNNNDDGYGEGDDDHNEDDDVDNNEARKSQGHDEDTDPQLCHGLNMITIITLCCSSKASRLGYRYSTALWCSKIKAGI